MASTSVGKELQLSEEVPLRPVLSRRCGAREQVVSSLRFKLDGFFENRKLPLPDSRCGLHSRVLRDFQQRSQLAGGDPQRAA
jgi:hypothetical protein